MSSGRHSRHRSNATNGAKTCVGGVVRHGTGSPNTLANPHISNVSIDPESGSWPAVDSTPNGDVWAIRATSVFGTKPKFGGSLPSVRLPAHNRPSGLNVGSARRRPAPSGGRRSPPLSSGAGLIIRTRPRRGICRPTVGNSPFTRIDRLARSIEDLQAIVRTLGEKAKQKPAHIARNVRKTSARGRFCELQHGCRKRMPVMHLLQLSAGGKALSTALRRATRPSRNHQIRRR